MRQRERAVLSARSRGTGEEIAYVATEKKLTGDFQPGGRKGEDESLFGTRNARDGNVSQK
jgi:hypothetical protein